MKKNMLSFGVVLASAASVMAQGTLNYNNRVIGSVVAPVYNGTSGGAFFEVSKNGNTASGFPPGTTTYAGALLTGSGYSAELFYLAAPNINTLEPEQWLVAAPGSVTTFRTSAILAGTIAPSFLTLPGTLVGGFATLQLRAWDNSGGTLASWAAASASSTPRGKSNLFNIGGLVDFMNPQPPDMTGLRSFNITLAPEPSTFLLGGLGAVAFAIFRRRK